jgi:hypothetical protein
MTNPEPSSIPIEEVLRQDQAAGARARRRRARRMIVPPDAQGQSALFTSLARRAHPTFELFIYSGLCGALLGLGYLLDSQPVLLLAILLAPLMTPWVGMLLAILAGSGRFFFETVMALLISAIFVVITGALAGFAARLFLPRTFDSLHIHSRLWLPELGVLALGAILLVASFVRSEAKPFLPSVVIAYTFFLPVSAAGFGLGSGVNDVWPYGVFVFLAHFALASIIGLLTLLALRLRPSAGGWFFIAVAILTAVAALVFLMGSGAALALGQPQPPAPVAVATDPSPTPNLPSGADISSSATPSATPTANEPTRVPITLEVTLPPSETPTVTLTFEPTPVQARILAEEGGGATLRQTPAGNGITQLENYTIVQVLPETEEVSGWTWAHIIVDQNGVKRTGWVLQVLLDIATPVPTWQPSATPTQTPVQ